MTNEGRIFPSFAILDSTFAIRYWSQATSPAWASEPAELAPALSLFLLVGVILLLVFVLATYVLLRTVRRYRRTIDRARAAPTAAEDVWAMHKVPDERNDEGRIANGG